MTPRWGKQTHIMVPGHDTHAELLLLAPSLRVLSWTVLPSRSFTRASFSTTALVCVSVPLVAALVGCRINIYQHFHFFAQQIHLPFLRATLVFRTERQKKSDGKKMCFTM